MNYLYCRRRAMVTRCNFFDWHSTSAKSFLISHNYVLTSEDKTVNHTSRTYLYLSVHNIQVINIAMYKTREDANNQAGCSSLWTTCMW